ncbi:hypothetical protein [Escherichia phage pEC-M719-6WT.1]|uniref:Uncharacterized protein n=1 Tax=Escherichia phage pEC-M719-6WT.1 TaxID=3056220 RepID=A0AA51U8V7_9CAUD|nr:hypothetical protein [Escherichia phage pEC-M719-6WT.1]
MVTQDERSESKFYKNILLNKKAPMRQTLLGAV